MPWLRCCCRLPWCVRWTGCAAPSYGTSPNEHRAPNALLLGSAFAGRSEGGLGIRDLATQNLFLLLKMLHRLHTTPGSRWAAWIWGGAGGRSLLARGELALGEHRAAVVKLLPLYRAISVVDVGDGNTCSFWWDRWLPCGAFAVAYPALFSHALDAEATVGQVRARGLARCLVPRLTRVGERELTVVVALLATLPARARGDERRLLHAAAPKAPCRPPPRTGCCGLAG